MTAPILIHPSPIAFRQLIARRLGDMAALDLRSLAVLRLVLAGGLAVTLRGHAGWVWREVWVVADPGPEVPDLLSAVALIGVGAAAAGMLALGYRTRLATLIAWLALLGLGTHPSAPLDAAGVLLRLFLLWGVFLPLGARYSFDSAARDWPAESNRLVSVAGLAVVVQLVVATLLGGPVLGPIPHAPPGELPATTLPGAVAQGVAWAPGNLVDGVDALTLAAVLALGLPVLVGPIRLAVGLVLPAIHLFTAVALEPSLTLMLVGVAWLAVLPTWAWDRLFAFLGSLERTRITLWAGSDRLLRLRLLRTFFLLPDTPIRSTHEDMELDVFRRQRKSWIVTDAKGYRYLRFRAFAEVCRASPILFPLAPLLRAVVVEEVGDAVFDFGQRHQATLHRLAHRLRPRPRPVRVRLPMWQQAVTAAALLVLLTWQLWVASAYHPGEALPVLDLVQSMLQQP